MVSLRRVPAARRAFVRSPLSSTRSAGALSPTPLTYSRGESATPTKALTTARY